MDICGDGDSSPAVSNNDDQAMNINDLIEVIANDDPTFEASRLTNAMYRPADTAPSGGPHPTGSHGKPYVKIVEQPASKSLRFRYECEGRSAGSIPGVNSTSERKTYPSIEICRFKGDAIVVASCVFKDPDIINNTLKYKTHPHNLVGKDHCRDGVYSVKVSGENPVVSFSNLGIQCVKRKDIKDALCLREKINVDPYKMGFKHRDHPQSIELNALRLCFQVFLLNPDKSMVPLAPQVSEVIYDKKAMSDLAITRVSHISGPVTGDTEIILLCEKVNKEEIDVIFYETANGKVVWEAAASVLLVHKMYAIVLRTPPYHQPHSHSHHRVYFELRRRADVTRSAPVPFEYTPLYTGTARALKPLALLPLLTDTNNNDSSPLSTARPSPSLSPSPEPCPEPCPAPEPERSLDELLEQVAELDEIYSENRTRLQSAEAGPAPDDGVEDFDDAGTYTSLQLAFKNPIVIAEPDPLPYEDVQVQTYRGPIIEFTPLKIDDDSAPPLPPKRVKKTPSVDGFKTSQTSVNSILKPGKQIPISRKQDAFNKTELKVAKSEPALPPAPKKRSFFSRLFRRREKSPAPSIKSEGKKDKKARPVGRSVSSVSGQRPSKFKSSYTSLKDTASAAGLSYADSITHISLHGDENERASPGPQRRPASMAPPPTGSGTILVAESVLALDASAFKKLQDDLELTDAEHYALYMAVAPHATVSEFDDNSCYYSPVDGAKFHN